MSRYDDDYDDNEDELDDDDNDGEEGVRRSTSNPFSSGANRPSSVRGAGLPQSRPPNNADGSTPSPIRSGGAGGSGGSSSSGGNSLFPQNRPNPGQNTSGGSSFSAPNRPAPSSGGGSGSSGSSPFSSPNRPGSPSSGSGGSSFSSPNRPGAPSGGSGSGSSPSGVQPYSRSPVSRAPADDDDKDDERGGNAPSRMLGNLGQKLGGDSSKPAEKPAGGNSFGSRLGGGGSSSGGSGSSNDSSTSRLTGGLGGLTSRLGGGDEKKDSGSGGGGGLGGLTSRFGGGDKKDEKKPSTPGSGGGGLGGLTSRFGGGDKKDNKPASASKPGGGGGGLGGLTSRFGGGGDKKDSKPADGGSKLGGLGGLTSRFGGGDKKDSGGSSTSSSSGFGNNRPGQSSSLGGGSSTSRPGAGGSSFGGSASSAGSMGGSSRAPASGGKSGANKQAGVPLMQRLRSLNPFTKQNEQIKSRASKAPRVDSNGLSLDNKLDILGVFLILSSLVLLLSSLSPTKGAITESLNRGISYLFGWGAVGVLLVVFAVGVWLILRHFGDEAPVIPRTRLIGLVMLFLGIMVAAQYIDAFQYKVGANQDYLGTVKTVFLPIAYSLGRGGGWIGGEIYFQLLSNFGEIGGFMVMVGWILVSIMLALSLSASDMAVVVISNARNLGDVLRQRNQQRAAQRAAKQQALAIATQQISITKPAAEPLPAVAAAASQAALPAPSPEASLPDRRIPITTGGRTSSVAFRAQGMDADAELDDEMQGTAIPAAEAPIPANALGKTGLFGGIGSRVRAAIPVGKQEENTSGAISSARANAMLDSLRGVKPADADEKPSERKLPGSGLLPFGKKTSGDAKPEANGASQSAAEKAASLRGRLFSNTNTSSGVSDTAAVDDAPAASAKPADTPSQSRFNPAARLGGLAASLSSSRSLVKDEPEAPAATPSVTASAATSTAEISAADAPPMNARERAIARARAAAAQADSEAAAPPQPADPLVTPSVSAPAAELPTAPVEQAATTPVESATQTAPAASVTAPETAASTPAETTPRLGDLLGRFNGNKPAGEAAVGNGTGQPGRSGGVQPFQRPPLSRPDAPDRADSAPKPEMPAARAETPMPDLQSRMRALREAETQKPTNPASKPPQMPAAASAEASAAFGKPSDPPFAVPRSTLSPDAAPPRRSQRNWMKPDPADLLSTGTDQEPDHDLLLKRAHLIEETLESFGAPGRVVDVRTGPVVTQFGVEPDYVEGRGGKKNRVKVGAIAALDKDLQLALGAKAIRIEAPVPGKGYVGIEVPNAKPEIVHLRDVLESAEFKKVKSPLAIALGQGVDGTPVAADLASMPHLLIAGTTGSGKSVCVNTIIASMLINNSPKTLKFIMVDPKRVELTQYNGIPHLIAPVVVELERIVSVLKWVTREMDERYRKFANAASRNIEDYNKHLPATEEAMPYIVVIIDELADLMMLAPDDTERVITRIAALARATGIHLVIATQRPSVDVVTGLIKANFPARVAFAVAGNTDSRVILDQPGAERLLGRGDMLYMSGDAPAPQRLQGVWVSDTEIGNITRFWRGQMSEQDIIDSSRPLGGMSDATRSEGGGVIMKNRDGSSSGKPQVAFWDRDDDDEDADFEDDDDALEDGEDEMYEQAVELVRRLNKASVSLLQRRLRIGYTRAARMIDTMEERGVVGPATEGSKPRDVLPVR